MPSVLFAWWLSAVLAQSSPMTRRSSAFKDNGPLPLAREEAARAV